METLMLFCEAWAKMKEAEAEASPDLYNAAAESFMRAKEATTRKKTRVLALANASGSAENVTVDLFDSQGSLVAEDKGISLPPDGQTILLVSELPTIRSYLASLAEFSGTLRVTASEPTSLLAVGVDQGPAYSIPVFAPPNQAP